MMGTYSLTIPGNPPIEISQDELRSLLGEIETELHRSKVYRLALGTVQKLLGSSAEQAKFLFKAVGREAIGLALRQLVQHHQQTANLIQENQQPQQIETPTIEPVNSTPQPHYLDVNQSSLKSSELQQCLTNVKPSKVDIATDVDKDQSGTSQLKPEKVETQAKNDTSKGKGLTHWLQSDKKASSEQTLIEQRSETLREIGKQLREAREYKNFSLSQLNIYTHIPIHQMEAIENGNLNSLPEDVFVRGFIRVMGNALGLNGTNLAASLPSPESVKTVLPTWYRYTNTPNSRLSGVALNPVHLYLGYTALVAGAVGGLSFLSSHQENPFKLIRSDVNTSSISHSLKEQQTSKPGLQKTKVGISVGHDISPPEAL